MSVELDNARAELRTAQAQGDAGKADFVGRLIRDLERDLPELKSHGARRSWVQGGGQGDRTDAVKVTARDDLLAHVARNLRRDGVSFPPDVELDLQLAEWKLDMRNRGKAA